MALMFCSLRKYVPFVNCLFQPLQVNEVKTESINSRIDPKLCPSCPTLLAFVSGLDLWVTCISSGHECRLTHVHKGKSAQSLLIVVHVHS